MPLRYEQEANAGGRVDFNSVVNKTRGVIIASGLDSAPWKSSDEFYLGIALGTFIARRTDGRPDVRQMRSTSTKGSQQLPKTSRAYCTYKS